MLTVRYTDPPTHIVGETQRIVPAQIDEGRQPVDELTFARLDQEQKERTPVRIIRPKRIRLSDDEAATMRPRGVIDLALCNGTSPGDVVAMTAVVRELHKSHPGKFRTVVQTWFPELWQGNPYITPESEIVQPRRIDWDWSETKPVDANSHFVHCWRDDLARKIGVPIPLSKITGDVYLTEAEKEWPLLGERRPFALVNAGAKIGGAIKQWGHENYQAVVDHFAGRIEFVQIGKAAEQRPLRGATNMLDRTGIRDLMRLVYWSDLVLCPITFLMHLSAAIPLRSGGIRPCVVLAGGREPIHTIQYEGHRVIGNVGSLPCCALGACWKMHLPHEGGHDLMQCERPVEMNGEWRAKCFTKIKVSGVIEAVESFSGVL